MGNLDSSISLSDRKTILNKLHAATFGGMKSGEIHTLTLNNVQTSGTYASGAGYATLKNGHRGHTLEVKDSLGENIPFRYDLLRGMLFLDTGLEVGWAMRVENASKREIRINTSEDQAFTILGAIDPVIRRTVPEQQHADAHPLSAPARSGCADYLCLRTEQRQDVLGTGLRLSPECGCRTGRHKGCGVQRQPYRR